ncbi:hypothetical protein QTP70_010049 [Hemibagrus guttatus]|uniref:Uncharacterized protein n=1 Tax=Hemibagrus guttatus TaxID=175788 RepID=A0AAE0QKS4_9TELE|nr:hypothetical protein QTP70_010049 [Hemibagrus guttatus]
MFGDKNRASLREIPLCKKSRDSTFRAGDKAALRTARAKLSRAIREVKRTHGQRIHGHFQDSRDSWCMWQGIQAITNYKTTPSACDSDASLPDALNDFYAQLTSTLRFCAVVQHRTT